MTIMESEQLKDGQQEMRSNNFHGNFDLNVSAQELELQLDRELYGNMEKCKDNISAEAQKDEEQVSQTKTFEGSVDHLSILAQSAEIVEAQCKDSVAMTHTNNQNTDWERSQELLDRLSMVSHVSSERRGPSCYEATIIRLTQVRKQARCKYPALDQMRDENKQGKHSQRKIIRLSQIKHQARCKSKSHLKPQMIAGTRNELQLARIPRLSEMKRLARSRNNSTVKEGTAEHMSQHCNKFRDSNCVVVDGVAAYNSCYRGASQSSVGRRDDENRRECQRVARRLRVFKTKNHRQQLKIGHTRLNALTMSSIGSSSMTNSQLLSNSATFRKDKDPITCQRELPETSGCTENLKANFGTKKLQGHDGSNESSGLRYKSLHHIPNELPLQNNVPLFTGFPIYTFQQYDPNMRWMLYMHHVQLKEYLRDVARQHRAERIEEKRAMKYKQQHSTNPVLANSEAQKELLPVKRLRLTQLRREVRLRNQCSILQGPDKKLEI